MSDEDAFPQQPCAEHIMRDWLRFIVGIIFFVWSLLVFIVLAHEYTSESMLRSHSGGPEPGLVLVIVWVISAVMLFAPRAIMQFFKRAQAPQPLLEEYPDRPRYSIPLSSEGQEQNEVSEGNVKAS